MSNLLHACASRGLSYLIPSCQGSLVAHCCFELKPAAIGSRAHFTVEPPAAAHMRDASDRSTT